MELIHTFFHIINSVARIKNDWLRIPLWQVTIDLAYSFKLEAVHRSLLASYSSLVTGIQY